MANKSLEDLREGVRAGLDAEFKRTVQDQPSPRQPSPIVETVQPASSSTGFIYGDGNLCEVGDLVQSGDELAEVKTVAGNGVVLDVPSIGVKVVDGSSLLSYRRIGKTKRG